MSTGTEDIEDNAVTDAKLSLDSVYTVWIERTGVADNILFKRNTISFDPSINLRAAAAYSTDQLAVAAAEYNVYVVWSQSDISGNFDILYRRSTDGGANFGGTVNLSNSTTLMSYSPAIAASGNNVYVVWEEGTGLPGNIEVLYRRSTDGGVSFDSIVNLSNNPGPSSRPDVAASGNNVYVVWYDDSLGNDDILYRRSTDGGFSFSGIVNLSNNPGGSYYPAIAASANKVYVVWHDSTPGNSDILYRRSTNGGANFGSTLNLSNNPGNSGVSAIAASANKVYVVWEDNTPGNFDILYKRSTNSGASFGGTLNLSNTSAYSLHPAIAASGTNVYVVWFDTTQENVVNYNILYRRSTNDGANFGGTVNLSNTAHSATYPAIAASNNLK
jgi:hypothetical protein